MLANLTAKVKGFWAKLNSDLDVLWQKDKVFLFAFGAIILTIKFRELLINSLILGSQIVFKKTQQESNVLSQQEDENNQKANQLVTKANQEANQPVNPDDNWYKNQ